MSLLENGTRKLLAGFGLGAVAVVAVPYALPVVTAVVRPLVKALARQSYFAVERVRLVIEKTSEAVEDLVAEVKLELDQERRKTGAGKITQSERHTEADAPGTADSGGAVNPAE